MLVLPAIDLLDGCVVRLAQGDRARVTIYSTDPVEMVERFANAGAKRIHIVDLNGAFDGESTQLPILSQLIAHAHTRGVEVQIGGGVRSAATCEHLLSLGANAVVIGTLAIREPGVAQSLCANHPGRITIAIDAKDGYVAISGWTQTATTTALELGTMAQSWGAASLLYTDVARDGLRDGVNVEATCALQAALEIPVIASGGVGTLDHLRALKLVGTRAVVVGRAIYEGAFTVEEALSC